MLSNPLERVIFRNKALDCFGFTIGPKNIDLPAGSGISPCPESWSLLRHPSNMRLWRPGSSQLSCHNQTDPLPIAEPERVAGADLVGGLQSAGRPQSESGLASASLRDAPAN
jgi:hypothetical protein